jgi:uncharacterized protein (TIGR02271 family)
MLQHDQVTQVTDHEVYGSDGDKIGRAGRVFVDDHTGRPKWLSVETGLFGSHGTFLPVEQATFDGDRVTVPFAKSEVKGAPALGGGDHLSPEDEEVLDRYYRGLRAGSGRRPDQEREEPDDGAMTVSEEQLAVSTRAVATERVRLRKHVVTEEVTLTVTLRRERFTVEREPLGEDEVGEHVGSTDFAGGEQEIVLYEEVPVVEKVLRPVERIRLGTEVTTEQRTVSGEVRKERVEVDQPDELTGHADDGAGRIG